MKFSINPVLKHVTLICGILLMSACTSNMPKEASVEDRVAARWEKLLGGDIAGAYEYLSPGYRSSVSSMDYQRSILLKRVQWTSAEYKYSECIESTCDVTILLGYKVAGALPGVKSYEGKKDIVETWIMVDGMWYLVP